MYWLLQSKTLIKPTPLVVTIQALIGIPHFQASPGASGIGRRVDNGKLVAFPARTLKPQFGSYAQRTVANSKLLLEIPENTDLYSSTAAASSLLTSVAPLKFSLDIQPGDTVLINSGKIKSDVKTISLEEAATQIDWQKPVPSGVRTVIKL